MSTYIDYDMNEQLTKVFTPESIHIPVIYDTYCNPEDIPWELWDGKLADLLSTENLRKGKFLWLYKTKYMKAGYRYNILDDVRILTLNQDKIYKP